MNKNNETHIPKDKVSINIISNLNESTIEENSLIFEIRLSDIVKKYVSTDLGYSISMLNEETYIADCPFCGATHSLHISDKYRNFACLNCRVLGNAVDFVTKIENISREKAIKGLEKHLELSNTPIIDVMKYKKKS